MTLKKGDKAIALSHGAFGDSLLTGEFEPFGPKRGYLRVVVFTYPDGSTYTRNSGPYPLESFAPYSETLALQLKEMMDEVEKKETIYNEARKALREFFISSR